MCRAVLSLAAEGAEEELDAMLSDWAAQMQQVHRPFPDRVFQIDCGAFRFDEACWLRQLYEENERRCTSARLELGDLLLLLDAALQQKKVRGEGLAAVLRAVAEFEEPAGGDGAGAG